jgi:hypothetical protein
MSKFKEGDEIVRTANFWWHAPEGWTSKVANGNKYIDKHGDLMQIRDCDWELAEDTSKPVTEEYKGNIYEIGQDYLFSDFNVVWVHSQLTGLASNNFYPFKTGDFSFQFIKEVPASEKMGTITPAPIALIDGNAYMFDYEGRKVNRIGIYHKHDNHFIFPIGYTHVIHCKNIRPMAVTESK